MSRQATHYSPRKSLPQKEPAIEWWFIQGYYGNPSIGRRFFMASVFKTDTALKGRPPRPGFTLLLSVLDPATGENQTLSQIDTATLGSLCRAKKDRRAAALDASLVEAYVSEIKEYGPPLPIRLKKKTASFKHGPLKITWGSFSLRERDTSFHLSLCRNNEPI